MFPDAYQVTHEAFIKVDLRDDEAQKKDIHAAVGSDEYNKSDDEDGAAHDGGGRVEYHSEPDYSSSSSGDAVETSAVNAPCPVFDNQATGPTGAARGAAPAVDHSTRYDGPGNMAMAQAA